MDNASLEFRVLLVEDEMLVAGMLRGMLSSLNCETVATTSRIDEAIEIVDRADLDLVLLDINLHGQMSYPFADKLIARGIPFIFASGYGPDSLPDGYQAVPFLKKPFRRSALEGALVKLLPEKHFRSAAARA